MPATSESTTIWDSRYLTDPNVKPPAIVSNIYLINGEIRTWSGKCEQVNTPIYRSDGGKPQRVSLGSYAMLSEAVSLEAGKAAVAAYNHGRGPWPVMTTRERITCLEKFTAGLKSIRNDIVALVMWEICKTKDDAEKEVDRTIVYINETIQALKALENKDSTFVTDQGISAHIRRKPVGVVLCVGPFNYPFNETYTTLIPSLIMGNTVVMKLPRTGVACHFPTYQLFRDCFPPGAVNIISGSGRETMPPLMRSGMLDAFAFIGTSQAADDLLKAHPKPHRLRSVLGLQAKNPAIVLSDADIENVAVPECVLGSLSYNGQRCTALKILFVHESVYDRFLHKYCEAVDALPMGLPWTQGTKITPLPEESKPGYLKELIEDAVGKGARIANQRGGQFDRTFVSPTVLVNVNDTMRIYHEEQFGPVVPVVVFKSLDEIFKYLEESPFGQQASVFSQQDTSTVAALIDDLVHHVARVNINAQCQRGPDSMPFTGRKDSAIGTLSVSDALRAFSIRAMTATKPDKEVNRKMVETIVQNSKSKFLKMEHLF